MAAGAAGIRLPARQPRARVRYSGRAAPGERQGRVRRSAGIGTG